MVGVGGSRWIDVPPGLYLFSGLVLLGFASFVRISTRTFFMILFAASVALGAFACSTSSNEKLSGQWSELIEHQAESFVVDGVVEKDLKFYDGFLGKRISSFILGDLRHGVTGERVPGKIKANMENAEEIRYGDALRVEGVLGEPRALRNPGGMDYKAYLKRRGIYALIKGKVVDANSGDVGLYSIKNRIIRSMEETFTPERAAFTKAIFLGERKDLDQEFKTALMTTGTFHVMAISGLHVGIVTSLLFLVLGVLRVPRRPKFIVMILVLVFYCLLTGANPPVVRATVMAVSFLMAGLSLRALSGLNALGFAGAAILLFNPLELFGAGFQLSFVAVWGLIVFMPMLYDGKDIREIKSDSFFKKAIHGLRALVHVSLIAWVVTAPFVIESFGRLYLLSPVINVMLMPLIFIVSSLITVFAVLSFLPSELLQVLALPISMLIDVIMRIVVFFEGFEFFAWNMAPLAWWTWVLFIMAAYMIFFRVKLKTRWVKVLVVLLLFLNCLLFDRVAAHARTGDYRVTFFDVGQGDSAFFEFPKGGNLLVDTGKGGASSAAAWVIEPYLRSRGIDKIDAVMISHPQYDHAGGLAWLLRHVDVGAVIDNGDRSEAAFHRETEKTIQELGVPHLRVGRGDFIEGFRGFTIEVLHPDEHHFGQMGKNDLSLTAMVSGGDFKVLLTGDLQDSGLEVLLQTLAGQDIHVLKVPHHGARLDIHGIKLLRRVSAEIGVISVGENNKYGHPHGDTMEALEVLVGDVLRTDRDGAVQFRMMSSGKIQVKRWGGDMVQYRANDDEKTWL